MYYLYTMKKDENPAIVGQFALVTEDEDINILVRIFEKEEKENPALEYMISNVMSRRTRPLYDYEGIK